MSVPGRGVTGRKYQIWVFDTLNPPQNREPALCNMILNIWSILVHMLGINVYVRVPDNICWRLSHLLVSSYVLKICILVRIPG